MALRNQPYLPLYVDDFANDEKLKECSASSIGVYIYLMCVMHKSEPYGNILLKQKYKQDPDIIKCFAAQLTKQMPFDFHTVTKSLAELLHEKVLVMESDMLIQKRMVKDNDLSETRSRAGKNGGDKTKKHFAKAKSKAKQQAKPVIGVGIDNGLELVYPFESIEFKANWREWVDYRKNEKKEPYATMKSEQRALMALSEFDETFACMLIKRSMNNGWQGLIFENTNKEYERYKSNHKGRGFSASELAATFTG